MGIVKISGELLKMKINYGQKAIRNFLIRNNVYVKQQRTK